MQAMPAFFRDEGSVLVSHRIIFGCEKRWSRAAHASRVLVSASHRNDLLPNRRASKALCFGKVCDRGTRALPRRLHLGQMCDAIFFAIARDPEIEVWIAELGGATDRATMEGFSWAARVDFKTSASCRDVAAVSRLMNDLRSKENEIINEC